MYGFHFLVWFLCVRGIRDTQVRVFIILSEGCHPRGGHLGIFLVGMCRPGLQIGIPF